MLPQDLEQRLKAQVDFPSPPQVATEIIALARDPDIEMAKVATAVGRDPAMTAKILRIANSAFYAQRRPSQNLRQALVIIGLNAALTLALSFSLVSSMRALRPTGIDFSRFWRRALLAATAARAFSEAAKTGHAEDIFLAAMLQDMGVLALDRAARDFYSKLPQPATHADWVAYEIAKLGKDHSYYTALMLRAWNLPGSAVQAGRSQPCAADVRRDQRGRSVRPLRGIGQRPCRSGAVQRSRQLGAGARAARASLAEHEPRALQ